MRGDEIRMAKLFADAKIRETINAEDEEYMSTCTADDIKIIANKWWTAVKGCSFWQDDEGNCYMADNDESKDFIEVCDIKDKI